MDRYLSTFKREDSDSESSSGRTLSAEHNIKAEECEESETAFPGGSSSSSHPPTLVERTQLSVDRNRESHSVRDEVQRVKQEVMEDEEVAWKKETRDIKLEVKQEPRYGQRIKDELPEYHWENRPSHKEVRGERSELGPRSRHRVPLRPLDPYEWPRRTPWLQHRETPRHPVSIANHDDDSAALYSENIRHLSQIHQAKYGIGSGASWRGNREPVRWPATSSFDRPRYSQQYPLPPLYSLFDCFCEEPYDRDQFRVPWKVDRRGEGTPQPQSVQRSRRTETERQPSQHPHQYGQPRREQANEEHGRISTEPRASQPHHWPQRENVTERTPAPYEPRTTPPLPRREDEHVRQNSKPESRKRRADDGSDQTHKRTRSEKEQTPSEQAPSEQTPTPTVQSYLNTRSRAASARQQNHSTRELRPNDNVMRFGLDVWFHGPGSTIRPLTTDEFANTFDNTVDISDSELFAFTSTAPAAGAEATTLPGEEGATSSAPVEATAAVATAVTTAVTAALAPATTTRTATPPRNIFLPPPETREARRARIIQEQRDQLRRVNEQRMQDYDETVRRQTMWRVAREAEQLRRLQGWRWENDPELASQGIILPPLVQNQHLPTQVPSLSSQSSQTYANIQSPPAQYAPPLQAPVDLMSGQAPSDTYYQQPYYGGTYDGRGVYGETITPRTPNLSAGALYSPTNLLHVQNHHPFQTLDQTPYRDAPAPDDGRTLMSPPQLVSHFHSQDRPLSEAGPPSESPQSPQTPQFYNTVGEYTHNPNRAILGTARPSWTAVRENGYGDEMQSGGQGISGYGNGCSCVNCHSQGGQYGNNGAFR